MEQLSETKNAVALIIEGLGTGLVGAYGAHTARTPNIDELAARGIVIDHCFVESLELQTQLGSLWSARHALQPPPTAGNCFNLWKHLAAADLPNCLITDCEQVAQSATRYGCEEVILVEPQLSTEPIAELADACLMRLFAIAAEELASKRTGLVWIHSRALRLPWDAPIELRNQFLDPDDPAPPTQVTPPEMMLDANSDPDWAIGWNQVAAAQTAIIDQAIGLLASTLALRPDASSWSWLLASLGGVPLGEHGVIGWGAPALWSEQIGAVGILVPSTIQRIGQRRPGLFQLPDLSVSLLEILGVDLPPDANCWGRSCLQLEFADKPARWNPAFQLAVAGLGDQHWIRCPAWSALFDPNQDVRALFVKPDDRWEVSDVASRRRDIVGQLESFLNEFLQSAKANRRGDWSELPVELTSLLR